MSIRKVTISLAVTLLAAFVGFMGGMQYFKTTVPSDLVRQLSGTQIENGNATVTRTFFKYAWYDDYMVFWPDGKGRSDLKWDSTWHYRLSVKFQNCLTTAIRADSLWVLEKGSNHPLWSIALSFNPWVKGQSEYHSEFDMKTGESSHGLWYVSSASTDSIAAARFAHRVYWCQLFTSVGVKTLTPYEYVTKERKVQN